MVLGSLGENLRESLRKIARSSSVDEKLVKEVVKDIQRNLISADVEVDLVLDLTERIKERAMDKDLPKGVSRREHTIKVVYEEISGILGEESKEIEIEKKPTVILMVGIQGSGKTTSTVKLSNLFRKKGRKVGVVCADTYRPGAYDQISQLSDKVNVDLYGDPESEKAEKVAKEGLNHFKNEDKEAIIIDTAGRHKDEKGLIEEMKRISSAVDPDEVILVIDGTIGQEAKSQARAFDNATELGSIIVTKLDSSAKGGGALSAVSETGAPIKYIGTGETLDDLKKFDPKRFVSRLLGMGDIEGLLEKVEEAEVEEQMDEKDMERMMQGDFTLKDMYKQMEMMNNMGSLDKIMDMIPGMGLSMPQDAMEFGEEKMNNFKIIMDSMTDEELEKPKKINSSRRKRIAKGSGKNEEEIKELISQYNSTKKMLKNLDKRKMGKLGKMFNGNRGGGGPGNLFG